MRKIDKIIIHCTATPLGRETTIEEITKWHQSRGFRTIGYHYLIDLQGKLHSGRKECEIGAHCKGYNKNSLGIAYVGGIGKDGNPKDTRNILQKTTMRDLVFRLLEKYPNAELCGHNEFSKKACPSFNVKENF